MSKKQPTKTDQSSIDFSWLNCAVRWTPQGPLSDGFSSVGSRRVAKAVGFLAAEQGRIDGRERLLQRALLWQQIVGLNVKHLERLLKSDSAAHIVRVLALELLCVEAFEPALAGQIVGGESAGKSLRQIVHGQGYPRLTRLYAAALLGQRAQRLELNRALFADRSLARKIQQLFNKSPLLVDDLALGVWLIDELDFDATCRVMAIRRSTSIFTPTRETICKTLAQGQPAQNLIAFETVLRCGAQLSATITSYRDRLPADSRKRQRAAKQLRLSRARVEARIAEHIAALSDAWIEPSNVAYTMLFTRDVFRWLPVANYSVTQFCTLLERLKEANHEQRRMFLAIAIESVHEWTDRLQASNFPYEWNLTLKCLLAGADGASLHRALSGGYLQSSLYIFWECRVDPLIVERLRQRLTHVAGGSVVRPLLARCWKVVESADLVASFVAMVDKTLRVFGNDYHRSDFLDGLSYFVVDLHRQSRRRLRFVISNADVVAAFWRGNKTSPHYYEVRQLLLALESVHRRLPGYSPFATFPRGLSDEECSDFHSDVVELVGLAICIAGPDDSELRWLLKNLRLAIGAAHSDICQTVSTLGALHTPAHALIAEIWRRDPRELPSLLRLIAVCGSFESNIRNWRPNDQVPERWVNLRITLIALDAVSTPQIDSFLANIPDDMMEPPRKLQVIIDLRARYQAQIAYLRTRAVSNQAAERRLARLQTIVSEVRRLAAEQRSRLRAFLRNQFHLQIGAFKRALRSFALERLEALVGEEALSGRTDMPLLENAAAIYGQIRINRRMLGRLLKRVLTENSQWPLDHPRNVEFLDQLEAHGIEQRHWLAPYRDVRVVPSIDPAPLHFYLETNPLEVLRMGNYFDTCLSADGFNAFSTVANACEGNKRIVYVANSAGTVIARQLIAVSARFELVGYRVYMAVNGDAGRLALCEAVHAFAERFARNCGLKLADDGEVPILFAQDWYDDGTEPWRERAVGRLSHSQ